MGLFRKSPPKAAPTDPDSIQAQLESLRRRIESTEVDQSHLGARVVALDDITADLSGHRSDTGWNAQLGELTRQLTEIQQRTAELQQHADARLAALRDEIDELRSASSTALDPRLTTLEERLSTTDATATDTATRLAALDERLTNVSTELANQIGELGSDIDAIADLPGTSPAATGGGERIEALAIGQTKLASEQARYEIAFREDLATLAEQIRRANGR
jgi:chromosome segregation ATPase